ncbi:ATP-binding protein [Thiorhodospira sibirica]|uniref:ATP-binding protein n=1 Tax=Thiorhodospira sibirica TaxID=154347 RepID=UPI00022C2DFA|nr:ATP-binding protein [Thiorhodospira sibirica]
MPLKKNTLQPPLLTSRLNVRRKLLLLLLFTLASALLLTTLALGFFIKQDRLSSAQRQFDDAFSFIREDFASHHQRLMTCVSLLIQREDVQDSMIRLVDADPRTPLNDTQLFSSDKQALSAILALHARTTSMEILRIYRPDGTLLAFARVAGGFSVEGIVMADESGKPVPLISTDGGNSWTAPPTPDWLGDLQREKFGQTGEIRYTLDPREGISIEVYGRIQQVLPDGSEQLLGYLLAEYPLSQMTRLRLPIGMSYAVESLSRYEHSQYIHHFSPDELQAMPHLLQAHHRAADGLLQRSDYYLGVQQLPLQHGDIAYFIMALEERIVAAEIQRIHGAALAVLVISALLVLPFGDAVARRTVAQPINQLLVGAYAFKEGRYDQPIILNTRDEFNVLANAFNNAIKSISQRERMLYRARATLEERVNERTAELQATNQRLEEEMEERRRAEEAANRAREHAEKANQAKSDFLSRMSHELRTPLNAILGFSQLLESDRHDPLNEEQLDNVNEILRAGRHLLSLINDILDLSSIEAGKLQISSEDVPLRDTLNACINLVEGLAQREGIAIIDQTGALEGVAVYADQTRLKQVLINLLSNAIKYNRPDGEVILGCEELPNQWIRLSITDTGQGIAPEKMPLLFQAFERLGMENTLIDGTGIGLMLSHRMIEMMGGELHVESEVGKGSTFWFTLPKGQQQSSEDSMMTQPPSLSENSPGTQTHVLLYIEDNPSNLRLVSRIMARRTDIQLLDAHTAELGLDLVRDVQRLDMILLDINLPGMDGYETIRRLRNIPKTAEIPIIAVSANAMEADIRRGKEAGFDEYLTKPINVAELLSVCDKYLQNAATRRS